MIWQFRVIARYNFGYPAIRIDSKNALLHAGNQVYRFNDIKAVRIVLAEQPAVYERALCKGAAYVYLTNVELYMNDNSLVQLKCNSKAAINKLMTDLDPNIEVIYEGLENNDAKNPLIFGLIFLVIIYCLVFFISVLPH